MGEGSSSTSVYGYAELMQYNGVGSSSTSGVGSSSIKELIKQIGKLAFTLGTQR